MVALQNSAKNKWLLEKKMMPQVHTRLPNPFGTKFANVYISVCSTVKGAFKNFILFLLMRNVFLLELKFMTRMRKLSVSYTLSSG